MTNNKNLENCNNNNKNNNNPTPQGGGGVALRSTIKSHGHLSPPQQSTVSLGINSFFKTLYNIFFFKNN